MEWLTTITLMKRSLILKYGSMTEIITMEPMTPARVMTTVSLVRTWMEVRSRDDALTHSH